MEYITSITFSEALFTSASPVKGLTERVVLGLGNNAVF